MPTHLRRVDEPGHVHFLTISAYRRLSFFWQRSLQETAVRGLAHLRDKFAVCLIGYVVMPDHVHLLMYPHRRESEELIPVTALLREYKQFVGYHGKAALRAHWRQHGQLWSEPLNKWARGAFERHALWTTRGHDFNVRSMSKLVEKLNYCHKNPVTRELVKQPEEWWCSSYRFYEMGDADPLTMDWNGRWPVEW